MATPRIPDLSILSIEDLRDKFERCNNAQQYSLDFKEFALLYRIMEGIKMSQLFESLYLSHATVSRCRHTLAHKLGVSSFEHALILVGKLDILND